MWYFAWVLGIGFAVLFAILNTLWGENEDAREDARLDAIRTFRENSDGHDAHVG